MQIGDFEPWILLLLNFLKLLFRSLSSKHFATRVFPVGLAMILFELVRASASSAACPQAMRKN